MIYEPKFSVTIPNSDTSFLAVPSTTEGFLNWKNHIIPKIIHNKENLTVLYSLKSDEMFPLKTIYARSENDINEDSGEKEEFRIANSIKGGIRQSYRNSDYFTDDKFKIIASSGNKTLSEFYTDICKFPMNPSANPFIASDLVVRRDNEQILSYLQSNGVTNITEFDYYPDYYLYFLLTRFYSYPFSDTQIKYSKYRKNANTFQKRFIDNVFDFKEAKADIYVEILMQENGIEKLKQYFDTKYDPSYWPKEYIELMNVKERKSINPNLYYTTLDLSEILITWTDNELLRDIKMTLPNRQTYFTRRAWIEAISGYLIATGIFGFQETPIFNDFESIINRPWRQYEDYSLLLS